MAAKRRIGIDSERQRIMEATARAFAPPLTPREHARKALGEWFKNRMDESILKQLKVGKEK